LIGCIKLMFKWAVAEEMVPPGVYHGLQTVAGLEEGRTTARESEPVGAVADELVEATLPHLNRLVATMARLQRLTGMRSGELVIMRAIDIDRSGPIWLYRPASHKGEHHDKDRVIALGPRAQSLVKEFLHLGPTAYFFSPRQAEEERRQALRTRRRTKVQPSQVSRKSKHPRKQPGSHYTPESYWRSIAYACEKAGLPHWHPHQLRHSHATEVRRRFGLEAAQVALGHSSADVTQVYAERNLQLAESVAQAVG
jgi:integrase